MIVVTGATGNVGLPLTQALAEAGQQGDGGVAARHGYPGRRPPRGGRPWPSRPASSPPWPGRRRCSCCCPATCTPPGARPADIIGQAVASGVRRVVLLSSLGAASRPSSPTRVAQRGVEDALRESGMDWAILRAGGFASNALWWAESVREQRLVAAPFGDIGVPIVDPVDIAGVAAACLVEDRHTGGVYELTGPELITPRQQAEAIATALRSPVRFHELTRDEAKAAMAKHVPVELAEDTLEIIGAPTPHELRISPGVQRVLGRAPLPFADWAARDVAAFR